MGRIYGGRRSRVRIDARANMRAALHIHYRRPNDRAYRAPNWNKHSLGQWVELKGVGDPECALMSASLHIQHRRPNDRAYRAPNCNKHSLGQWVELMGVGDPVCALMRALREQTCAHPCTFSIDGQTTGPIEP
jgi:hypothetical protein